MPSISEIMANLQKDVLVSPNRYRVLIIGGGQVADATPDIMFNCASISIPSLNINTTADKRTGIGSTQTFPDGRELTPIIASFYESRSFKERKFFSNWMNTIYNPITKRFEFFDNIKKIIQIDQFDRSDKVIYTVRLYDAYPTHVSEMNRAYAAIDTIEQFSVSFAYNELSETFYDKGGVPIEQPQR